MGGCPPPDHSPALPSLLSLQQSNVYTANSQKNFRNKSVHHYSAFTTNFPHTRSLLQAPTIPHDTMPHATCMQNLLGIICD